MCRQEIWLEIFLLFTCRPYRRQRQSALRGLYLESRLCVYLHPGEYGAYAMECSCDKHLLRKKAVIVLESSLIYLVYAARHDASCLNREGPRLPEYLAGIRWTHRSKRDLTVLLATQHAPGGRELPSCNVLGRDGGLYLLHQSVATNRAAARLHEKHGFAALVFVASATSPASPVHRRVSQVAVPP